jgi:hypothetical protein
VAFAVKAGVVNEPVVPVPPPPDEVHEVLLVDDHATMEVAPYAIEDGVAVRVMAGLDPATTVAVTVVVVPPPPPHDTSPETVSSKVKRTRSRNLEPAALLFDMMLSLQ